MPFGAELRDDGTRFRLWAPAASSVELVLEGGRGTAIMDAVGGGWFELLARAPAGTRYRFRIDGGTLVPDPASRFQPDDVLGPSEVVDPAAYRWETENWRGRPWHEAAIYELHVGTFSPEGTFEGARRRLDHLGGLGITAVELMPLADFAGRRNWGYDGVLPFAPDSAYGAPDDLKRLIDAAHARGLMMILDVVYNHFGPEGNFLNAYAPQFFTERVHTPWGAAIDFSRREVRDFFIHNALYWLEEYRFDGLRLDAVHAIHDDNSPDVIEELAATANRRLAGERPVHIILENDDNEARYLARTEDGDPRYAVAQWNDDIHHALHAAATGEAFGYYADYADRPVDRLLRCLTEGFAYQGEPSRHRDGGRRGSPSGDLPPAAFVSFLQNHDQIGNRAFGERIAALADPRLIRAMAAILLLAPAPPMLFMGEEWGATEPFLYFCDFHDELADAVRDGRRREFARFPAFQDEAAREKIPDPNAEATFRASMLAWDRYEAPPHADWLAFYSRLLALRRDRIVPLLADGRRPASSGVQFGAAGLGVTWRFGNGATLRLLANLGPDAIGDLPAEAGPAPGEDPIFASDDADALGRGRLPGRCAVWFLGATDG
jgi:maltooligosyltrehalose trehalohydrolase